RFRPTRLPSSVEEGVGGWWVRNEARGSATPGPSLSRRGIRMSIFTSSGELEDRGNCARNGRPKDGRVNSAGTKPMISRRRFVKSIAGGMTLAAVPLGAYVKLNIGIGAFSYHNLSVDDMIVQLNALRIKEIEMSRGEFMLFSKPDASL